MNTNEKQHLIPKSSFILWYLLDCSVLLTTSSSANFTALRQSLYYNFINALNFSYSPRVFNLGQGILYLYFSTLYYKLFFY